MEIREPSIEDLRKVDAIYERDHAEKFKRPSVKLRLGHLIAEEDGKILGYGIVNVFMEATVILNKKESVRNRLRAMDILLNKAVDSATKVGVEQLFIQTDEPAWGLSLKKRYGFSDAKKVVLVLEL